ncbi:MAG: lysine transporter LysE [Chitinophagaceae bacterium]|nr:MAG: lysine transporter LysE [Chitinophagaceae bacterium]
MWQALLSGLTLGFILALSVGPVIFTIIKQSINNGHVGGFSFVAGVWVSDILLVVISNAFSALVSDLLEYRNIIAFIGSLFLVAMGVYYLFFKKITLKTDADGNVNRVSGFDMAKLFSSGFFINTLNPSVFIFWLTTATTFAVKYSFQQRLIIFSVCLALNIIADIMKVFMAGKLRKRLTLHNISLINKVSGTILIGFGIALLYGAFYLGGL